MAFSRNSAWSRRDSRWRLPGAISLAAAAAVVIATAAKGLHAAFANDDFPEALAIKLEALPLLFPLHMISGALALVLVPLALALRRRPRWHRLVGRIAALDIAVAGITAYPVALLDPVTPWSAAGFAVQASVWLVLLGQALVQARRRNYRGHAAAMVLMAATTSGAVFFRLYLALWAIFAQGRHFDLFYACDAWLAWLVPLAVAALAARRVDVRRG